MTVRTIQEIVARIGGLEGSTSDFFGFQTSDLIGFLPFEDAKPFLKDTVKAEDWTPTPLTEEGVKQTIHDYMEFAWGKANDCRGLSAGRSLDHMKAWLFALGEDEAWIESLSLDGYTHYGKPQLRAICKRFGWDWTQWDDGSWTNYEGEAGDKPEDIQEVGLAA